MNDAVPNSEPLFDLASLDLSDLTESFAPDKQPVFQDDEKFVVFFLDDELFAVAASRIAEVVRPLECTVLPGSPGWLYGIANLRGEIVSVLNLSKICGKKSVIVSPKSKVIVLKPAHGTSSIAFPVDRVSEIVTFNPENINLSDDPRFFGKAQHEKYFVNLLDTENLWSSLS